MSDVQVQMTQSEVTAAVNTFTQAANDLESYLSEAQTAMTNVKNQTESVWITGYVDAFTSLFNNGVTTAVATIKETATKVGEIAAAYAEEDNK